MTAKVFTVADDVTVWVADGGSIHINTKDPNGDPVEPSEALQLAAILKRLVKEVRA
jgi:hypothetical protein